ncbi:hypothetical protein N0V84_002618 [Fusarium piperis]|uniref:Uncharacterized protein n=1 Tax=Fusarium piperis TaxID=1435070 RepID=A0A9W9BSY5_9HYPO|nr:hypothetical protein N0V84_002618 [Fusarium piperis]
MSLQSRLQSLVAELGYIPVDKDSFFNEVWEVVMEEAWQEKVQREGIRLKDEPWHMRFPLALLCRKRKAYFEKMAREEQDPWEVQNAHHQIAYAQLREDQVIFHASDESTRLSPEAANARIEEFDRQADVLYQRLVEHTLTAKEFRDEGFMEQKGSKGKEECPDKTNASESRPGFFGSLVQSLMGMLGFSST